MSSAGSSGSARRSRDQLPARLVEPLVLALGRLGVELLLGALERLAVRVQLERPVALELDESREHEGGQRRRELADDLALAAREHRLEQLDDQRADRRLERAHPLVGERGVQRPAVARVLGRVEVERRAAPRHRVARHDDAVLAREGAVVGAHRLHVVVARERPEVPARAAGHRALAAQPRPRRVRARDERGVERVEVRLQGAPERRASPTRASGSSPARRSPRCARCGPSSSSSVRRSISVPSGAPAQRCGPMPNATCCRMFGTVEDEAVRLGEDLLVAVRGGEHDRHRLVLADQSCPGTTTSRVARACEAAVRRQQAEVLVDGRAGERRVAPELVLQFGVLGEVDHHRADEDARRDHPDDDELPDRAEQHVLRQPGREQAGGRIVGGVERLRLPHRDDLARDVVELQARALDLLVDEVLDRDVELPRRVADA